MDNPLRKSLITRAKNEFTLPRRVGVTTVEGKIFSFNTRKKRRGRKRETLVPENKKKADKL